MPPMRCIALLLLLSLPLAGSASQAPHIDDSKIDAVFSRWTRETPGCAVGVARPSGEVNELSLRGSRVFDLRLRREGITGG